MFGTWVARGGDPGDSEAPLLRPLGWPSRRPLAMVGVVGFALVILLVVLSSSRRAYTYRALEITLTRALVDRAKGRTGHPGKEGGVHGLERARSCNYGYPTRCGRVSHPQNERSFPSPDGLGKDEGFTRSTPTSALGERCRPKTSDSHRRGRTDAPSSPTVSRCRSGTSRQRPSPSRRSEATTIASGKARASSTKYSELPGLSVE